MGTDPSPYAKMSQRKLLMVSIMDDTIRTHGGGEMVQHQAVIVNLGGAEIVLTPRVGKVAV